MEQLEKIYPTEKKVLFGEDTITIRTFQVGDVAIVAKLMSKILKGAEGGVDSTKIVGLIVQAMQNDSQDVVDLVALCTGLEETTIKKINPAAFLFLITHIVEQNRSFFVEDMLPQGKKLMALFQTAAPKKEQPKVGVK